MGNFVGVYHTGLNDEQNISNEINEKFNFHSDAFTCSYHQSETKTDQTSYFENEAFFIYFFGECYNVEEVFEGNNTEDCSVAELIATVFPIDGTSIFPKINGKFVTVIYQKDDQTLIGARDHFGVIPLFYMENKDKMIIGTEKSDVTAFLDQDVVNEEALQHYFSFQFVPEPYTLHKDVTMMDSATYFVKKQNEKATFHKYWQPAFHPKNSSRDIFIDQIRERLYDSVERRMNGQQNVGAFLSGGIDSTFIASIAKEFNPLIKTFSVGFERDGFSEIDVAKETADKIDVENISKVITAEEYVEIIPEVLWHLEEPLADPSCIPLYYLSKLASEHIDIALSGEGADEIFAGYNIYREPTSLKLFQSIPKMFYPILKGAAKIMPEQMSGKSYLLRGTTPLQERYIGNAKLFEEQEKHEFLKGFRDDLSYQQLTAPYFQDVENEPLEYQMQYVDLHTWMRGDILLKARKMSKANHIEIRMPFADHGVFNIANDIPIEMKIANNTTKYILRQAAEGIIPDHVLNRRKLGFPVPIRHWLSNELNGWAKNVIQESAVDEYIDKNYVNQLLDLHTAGKGDYSRKIWSFLIFMIWHQVFIEEKYDFTKVSKRQQ